MAQKSVNKDHGGRDVLLDIDILNLDLTLIGAGRQTLNGITDWYCPVNFLHTLMTLLEIVNRCK